MAALLKKRALAEYTQVLQDESQPTNVKNLRLVRRTKAPTVSTCFDINSTHSPQDVLNILVSISENLPEETDVKKNLILKLISHFHKESEAIVKVKIISLICELQINLFESQPDQEELVSIIEEFSSLLKKEHSHKVKAQFISSLHKLGAQIKNNPKLIDSLLFLTKQNLTDLSHQVQCNCLRMISELAPNDGNADAIVQLIGEYIHSQEPRVRCCSIQSIIKLHQRNFLLDKNLYQKVCSAVNDDYEGAREVALKLIQIFSELYPEHNVPILNSLEFNRLVDDAFSQICQAINDLSMKVRVQAAALLGKMTNVSPDFLEQTLDKKLMSNMRKKRSAHERQNESYTTGEWSSGKKWNDDAPKEHLMEDSVNLVNNGTCGAFVHGLEDEFLEVRSASLDSLCALALNSSKFAKLSLDFLVDMLNDEIEDVRLKAIHCLMKVNSVTVLREDQVETLLCVLEDYSMDIREALHRMLASCNLSTQQCLKLCINNLLENLKRYPQDKHSIWRCLQKLGLNHQSLTLPLVPEILAFHPYFDTPEPDIEDPAYISKLILVFNAAVKSPTMIPLFEDHTLHHYSYLRHSLSSYVPKLKLLDSSSISETSSQNASSNTIRFLHEILERVSQVRNANFKIQQSVQVTAIRDLEKLAEIESSLSAVSHCASMYINCQLLMAKILSCKNSMTMTNITLTNTVPLSASIDELVKKTFCLTHLFGGLTTSEYACMMQMYSKALALQLTYTVNTSNTSTLSLCDNFLDHIEMLQKYLYDNNVTPSTFTSAVFVELSKLEDPKPGAVARLLLPLLTSHPIEMIKFDGEGVLNVNEIKAEIIEPTGDSDNPLKFTSGLVLGVDLHALISNLKDVKQIRVKIKYPDQHTQVVLPRLRDFKPTEDGNDHRLLTSILLSHNTWSEACHIELSIALDVGENNYRKNGSSVILDLCKPIKVYVSPKPPRRGI